MNTNRKTSPSDHNDQLIDESSTLDLGAPSSDFALFALRHTYHNHNPPLWKRLNLPSLSHKSTSTAFTYILSSNGQQLGEINVSSILFSEGPEYQVEVIHLSTDEVAMDSEVEMYYTTDEEKSEKS